MKISKVLARSGILLFSAMCLLVFQLANSIILPDLAAFAQEEFPTVPPPDSEFSEAFQIETPQGYSPGLLGPIHEDSLPEVTRPEFLTDPFGYSEILGEPGRYLVWSTD